MEPKNHMPQVQITRKVIDICELESNNKVKNPIGSGMEIIIITLDHIIDTTIS